MIKERQLAPGRMLSFATVKEVTVMDKKTGIGSITRAPVWIPCMVVSYVPNIDRRHTRSAAQRESWDVLVFWFDLRRERLQKVNISNDAYTLQNWKVCDW